jgi:hypothetical protein
MVIVGSGEGAGEGITDGAHEVGGCNVGNATGLKPAPGAKNVSMLSPKNRRRGVRMYIVFPSTTSS